MTVEVRRVRGHAELAAAVALRREVFSGEQGVRGDGAAGPRDDRALQLLAVEDDGTVLGTCRLVADGERGRLGGLVVARAARGAGIGAALLADAEREARAAGVRLVRLNAQSAALGFYERAGYVPGGEPFVQEGIEHVAMEKALDG